MADPIKAQDIKPEPVKWLWKERIPIGMITIVAGRPDQGKGLFAVHIGAEVTKRGGHVLHSAAEDSDRYMTRPRYEAAGARLSNVHLWPFRLPVQMRELEHILTHMPIDLIVIDPFAAHLSGGASRHSDNIRDVLTPLASLLDATDTALIIIEHALKNVPQNGTVLAAIGGPGSGLPAAARMAYVLGIDPDDKDRRILAPAKANIRSWPDCVAFNVDSEEINNVGEVPLLLYDGECTFDAMRLFTKKHESPGRPPDKRAAASEWLTNYLAAKGSPVRAGVIFEDAKQVGMTAKTLRGAATDMGVVRNPVTGGRNCTWDLPDDIKQSIGGIESDDVPEPEIETAITDEMISELLNGFDGTPES